MNGHPSGHSGSAVAAPISRDTMSDQLLGAARDGDADRLRQLLRAGADPDARDGEGFTALMIATREKQAGAVLELIYANADINAFGPSEQTALILAASGGNVNIAAILINAGAECHEDTPEEARKNGHYGLANSLENGALQRLYKKRLRQKQLEQKHKRDDIDHDKLLSHLFEKSSKPVVAPTIQRVRGFCGRMYSKFAARFMAGMDNDGSTPDAAPDTKEAPEASIYTRAVSFAQERVRAIRASM